MNKSLALLVLVAVVAYASETLLDPGPGTLYLANWCGGQAISEVAVGFNADGSVRTILDVSARCPTGTGRLRKTVTYRACWFVDFDRDGEQLGETYLGAIACPEYDPSAVYEQDGIVLTTTAVTYVSGAPRVGYRAVLSQ